ncbi:MAG: 16S rRNA (adenine(1518)-N(6)/adenine(1519)-N(6))-dimethyltransferase RsmA [Chloroflexota bacterium]|nr:16S rRNA (adenine(1518)-N(6)/adenine(1519)-N(6))-dimethyltransferase RsmA [Chloroflexota bacterium]
MKRPRWDLEQPTREIKEVLREQRVRPKKSLGQRFLIDEVIVDHVIKAAELYQDDVVVEIGPGLGVLTRELAKRVQRVLAVEVDRKLAAKLRQDMAQYSNVSVVRADILETDPSTLILPSTPAYKVVADIPYYITSPIIRHFLEASLRPERMVLMVQREVAEAIVAQPGKMSLLAISVQYYAEAEIIANVPAESFYPIPKVDSAVLRVHVRSHPALEVDDTDQFFAVVKSGFNTPRKQLRNSLANGLGISTAESGSLLEKASIMATRRAETLSLQEWARLYEVTTACYGKIDTPRDSP